MVGARYSRGEVLFLLSLTHEQAIELDAFPRDSCADLSDDDISTGGGGEEQLPVVARWADVQRVKRELVREKEALAIVQLRASGFSETEIARLSGRDRLAVRRRWHATIDEIVDKLGGSSLLETFPVSRVSACLRCGEKPRVRLRAIRRRVRGGWKEIQPERQASTCEECMAPEFRSRILAESVAAA